MGKQKREYIRLLTVLGLIAVLSLQSIWIYNTYMLIRKNIQESCNEIVEESIEVEMRIRMEHLPDGTQIVGGEMNDTLSPLTSFCDNLSKMGNEMSIERIDSIVSVLLSKYNVESRFVVYIVNPQINHILQMSKKEKVPHLGSIKSNPFPIKVDSSEAVQLVLVNPYNTLFERMGLLMIASFIMLVLVIGCIGYQIKVILYQKKIAKLRADFSFAMIHDMKSPLTAIMSCANFLNGEVIEHKPEMKEKFFNVVKSQTAHLLKLMNKVLTISKLEERKDLITKKRFLLLPLLENLIEVFQVQAVKPVHFTLDIKVNEVYGDEEYLEEAISNLIDNAVKYSKESVDIAISTSVFDKGDYILIKVRDNGLGFSQNEKNMIFSKFERASAFSRSSKGGAAGFGLGLNYVYQVMDAHGGEVTANSVPGEFSEFILFLPRQINKHTENN